MLDAHSFGEIESEDASPEKYREVSVESDGLDIDDDDDGIIEAVRSPVIHRDEAERYHRDDDLDLDDDIDEDDPYGVFGVEMDDDFALEHEVIFSVGRMAELLEGGSEQEKSIVLFEIQQLLDHCLEDTLTILVPVLCLHVQDWSSQLQMAAAEALLDVVHHEVDADVAKMISAASFRVVNRASTDRIYESWGEILVTVLPFVQWSDEELNKALALVDMHAAREYEVSRKLAARVLGALCSCLDADAVESLILERSLRLCEDENVEVRGMATESLQHVGASLTIESVEKSLWPKVLELLDDQDVRIHAATLRSIAHIVEEHREQSGNERFYYEQLPVMFLKHCEFARRAAAEDQRVLDDETYLLLEIFAEIFGPLLLSSYPHIRDDSQRRQVHKTFLAVAACNGPVIRRHCAYNLPAVSDCLARRFSSELSGVVESLSRDSDAETRWNLAGGLHWTLPILISKSTADNLSKAFVALLRDESPLIRVNVLQHFGEIVAEPLIGGELPSPAKFGSLFRNLRILSEGNWRTQELLAKQLEGAAHMIPYESLKCHVIPLLFQMAEESTAHVRKALMTAIVKCVRQIPEMEERHHLVENFRVEWAQGGVYWMRIAFLEGVLAAYRIYSRELFRETFLPQALRLCGDPVPNVRLRLATVLRDIWPAAEGEESAEHALKMLQLDEDIDVQDAVGALEAEVERLRASPDDGTWQEQDRKKVVEEEQILKRYFQEKATSVRVPEMRTMLVKSVDVSKYGGLSPNRKILASPQSAKSADQDVYYIPNGTLHQEGNELPAPSERNERVAGSPQLQTAEVRAPRTEPTNSEASQAPSADTGSAESSVLRENGNVRIEEDQNIFEHNTSPDSTNSSSGNRNVMRNLGSLLKPRKKNMSRDSRGLRL